MTLKEFIEQFVCPNTLIRLQYNVLGGHEEVMGDSPKMEHELIKSEYSHREVIGVTDILYIKSHYTEAVNIVIEREIV